MKITKRPPELNGIRAIVCNNCLCELTVTREDVIALRYEKSFIVRYTSKDGYTRASGYIYTIKCPVCNEMIGVFDHLTDCVTEKPYSDVS